MRIIFCILAFATVACVRVSPPLAKNPAPPPPPAVRQGPHDRDKGVDAERNKDADADRNKAADADHDKEASRRAGSEEAEDAKDATEFFLKRRLPPGQQKLPVDRYLAARDHIKNMPAFSVAGVSPKLAHPNAAAGWTPLGPGNVGGRTRSLVIDPANPTTIYAAFGRRPTAARPGPRSRICCRC